MLYYIQGRVRGWDNKDEKGSDKKAMGEKGDMAKRSTFCGASHGGSDGEEGKVIYFGSFITPFERKV